MKNYVATLRVWNTTIKMVFPSKSIEHAHNIFKEVTLLYGEDEFEVLTVEEWKEPSQEPGLP